MSQPEMIFTRGQLADLLGKPDADHFVENWRAMAIVFEKGDLTQTIFRSIKPD